MSLGWIGHDFIETVENHQAGKAFCKTPIACIRIGCIKGKLNFVAEGEEVTPKFVGYDYIRIDV